MAEHLYAASAAAPGGAEAGAGAATAGTAPGDGQQDKADDVIDVEFEEKK
jgi:molecular chaperone DnaK